MIKRIKGFSLIELMIVVAVIGILAAIAYPNYTEYVRKARRASAQAVLMDVANKQQTYLLSRRTYTDDPLELGFTDLTTDKKGFYVPDLKGFYTFFPGSDGVSFTGRAEPSAALAAQGEKTLSVDNRGNKLPADAGYWGK